MQILIIAEQESGQRLDKYLQRYLALAPKSFLYKMLRKKNIVLNSKKAVGNEKLQVNDQIKLFLSPDTIIRFSKSMITDHTIARIQDDHFMLPILYEDDHMLIMNKPAGMLSQKAAPEDVSMNEHLIHYLLQSKQITHEQLKTFHPAVCNRLDRNTSGIILAGKTMHGLQELSARLKDRSIKKEYLCLVSGHAKKTHQKGYLQKSEKYNKVVVLEQASKDSTFIETAYQPLCSNEYVTLLLVDLITGKTHQIRSHLASMGHPIIGDYKYGNREINLIFRKKYGLSHQLLHAYRVSFEQERTFVAAIPDLFANILKGEYLEDWQHEKNNNA